MYQVKGADKNLDAWRKKANNSQIEKSPYGEQKTFIDSVKRDEKKWFFETIERQETEYFPFGKGGSKYQIIYL